MPALQQHVIDDIQRRLTRHLAENGESARLLFLRAGGSAAVFRKEVAGNYTVLKGFDPSLVTLDPSGPDLRRLALQQRLIGHSCSSLVQTLSAGVAEKTILVEMEWIDWPQLSTSLSSIPDDAVLPLISQLVEAVRFLEGKGIVHRDIKPENIHVSPDFRQLKLLDLGVVREFHGHGAEEGGTDHGSKRPFLATAQYSSPEYLFRLDEPSTRLWKALNIYQIGAVLHDLIMKKQLFDYEMSLGNRWLVARSVLLRAPSFDDGTPGRLAALKALASRCLTKDIDVRLKLVDLEDLGRASLGGGLSALKSRLQKPGVIPGAHEERAAEDQIAYERDQYLRLILDKVRIELIEACGVRLPINVRLEAGELLMDFRLPKSLIVRCVARFEWAIGLYRRNAKVYLQSWIDSSESKGSVVSNANSRLLGVTSVDDAEGVFARILTEEVAGHVSKGLDLAEASESHDTLIGLDLAAHAQGVRA